MRCPRRLVWWAAVALVVSACGTGQDGGAAKTACGTGRPATGTPITVGAIVTASGGIDFSSATKAARAYFDCVNAGGGIGGRPVEYLVEDDGLNPQKASALATKLAGDRDLVALVGGSSFVACGVSGPIWEQNGLFDVLAVGVPRACFESPRIAPVNAGPRISAVAAAQYAVEVKGARRVAQISNRVPGVGDWTQDGVRAYLRTKGLTSAGDVLHDPGVKDATAVLLEAMRGRPDAIILQDPAPDDAAILKAAQAQGLKDKVTFVCLTPCYDTAFPGQVGGYWEGFVSNSEFTMLDAGTPDNKLWRRVMDEYADDKAPRDSFAQGGFLAAKIFVDTLTRTGGTIDRASVSRALSQVKGFRSDLLCAPWYFGRAARHNANHDTRYVTMKGGGWTKIKDCTPAQDPDLAPLLREEKQLGLTG